MTFNPANYTKGDIVKVTQTFRVVAAGGALELKDVKSRECVTIAPASDTMQVEMVKRAVRPKPKAGEILTGAEIGKIQWKRGTVIRCVRSSDGNSITWSLSPIVLHLDGRWHDVDGLSPSGYEFDDLNQYAGFEILLVA